MTCANLLTAARILGSILLLLFPVPSVGLPCSICSAA